MAILGDLFSINGPYARFINWLWNMLVISVLWIVCCIPLVTIGAASTAAYYAMAKVVRHHTGKVVSQFFSSFRANFVQATVLTFLIGLVLGVLLLECVYLYSDPSVTLGMLYLFSLWLRQLPRVPCICGLVCQGLLRAASRCFACR